MPTLADALNNINAGDSRWIDTLIAYGYGFHVTIGAFSTPIAGGGAAFIIDQNEPRGVVSVPPGWTIRPFRVHCQAQTPLLAADSDESEIVLAVDVKFEWKGDGTFTAQTPWNMRTDRAPARGTAPLGGCPIRAASAFSADMTATDGNEPVLDIELAHSVIVADKQGTPATGLWTKHELLYEPAYAPFLVGPCAMYLYIGGTAATPFFAQVQFVALPSSFVTKLA
jgi:hypothetical protein